MTVYKRCPFCEALFEIGPDDDEPMRRHLRTAHADDHVGDDPEDGSRVQTSVSASSVGEVRPTRKVR